jgi:hypothetical protein
MTCAEVAKAFRPSWERLGVVARRLGKSHGSIILVHARQLRDEGLVESRMYGGHFQWRRAL